MKTLNDFIGLIVFSLWLSVAWLPGLTKIFFPLTFPLALAMVVIANGQEKKDRRSK